MENSFSLSSSSASAIEDTDGTHFSSSEVLLNTRHYTIQIGRSCIPCGLQMTIGMLFIVSHVKRMFHVFIWVRQML